MLLYIAILTAVAAGYAGAPFWATVACSLTLVVVMLTRRVRAEPRATAATLISHAHHVVPLCFFAAFTADGVGRVAQLLLSA